MRGLAKIDFGEGNTHVSAAVSVPDIDASTIVHAWLYPKATADHTVEEHLLAPIRVVAGECTAGVGFTIYAFLQSNPNKRAPTANGKWFVAWSY